MSKAMQNANASTENNEGQNADPSELENFNQLAHTWWDESGQFGALHKINPVRIDFIEQHKSIENKLVLDIGCGGGILSEALASIGGKVTGIDLADEVLTIAKLHSLESGIPVDYVLESAEEHAQKHPNQYDIITCMEMLEHVPDPSAIIRAAAHMVKPGGWVFLSTLNRNLKSYLLAIVGAEQLFNLVPKGTHNHQKFIQPAEIDSMARQTGLILKQGSGIDFSPFSPPKLNDSLAVNYLLAYQKPNDKSH
ncbi:bifunctional 3-demethylubiquinol 3-O-methyltransferase/2-polyprenyl-6-hydroxyphenol methylase [Hydrogenovibrio sp. SC-1]|nr:bifunctional 3-demethylubiquinol 3-O-methyltransferase/2-polyprenyl-6-hydroxyphenol methylase [Hydrogenovibrio sp. SC-1]